MNENPDRSEPPFVGLVALLVVLLLVAVLMRPTWVEELSPHDQTMLNIQTLLAFILASVLTMVALLIARIPRARARRSRQRQPR